MKIRESVLYFLFAFFINEYSTAVALSSGKKTAKMKYVKKENHCKAEQDENDESKERNLCPLNDYL